MLNNGLMPPPARPVLDKAMVITIAVLLLAATFKGETVTSGYDDATVAMVTHPIVSQLKSNGQYIFFPILALCLGYEFFVRSFLKFNYDLISFLLIAMSSYFFIRVAVQYPDTAGKYAGGAAIMLLICTYLASCRSRLKAEDMVFSIAMAFAYYSLILIALNLMTYLSGYGFLASNPRFYGTSVQPNFMGVQLAMAQMALFAFWIRGGHLNRAIAVVSMLICLFLLVLTGSRTAMIVVAIGAYGAFWQNLGPRPKIAIGLLVLAVVVIALGADSILSINVYDRGGDTNTRAGAWSYLFDRVTQETIWGFGEMEGYSENSLLRGWAAFGLLAPVLLLSASLLSAYHFTGTSQLASRQRAYVGIMKGIFWGLLVGSVSEGYLIDSFSTSIIAFAIACVTSSEVQRIARNNSNMPLQSGIWASRDPSPYRMAFSGTNVARRGGRRIPPLA